MGRAQRLPTPMPPADRSADRLGTQMQHTEHDNNPIARPLATLPECFLFVKCPTYHSYQRTKCPTYHIYQRTVRPTYHIYQRTVRTSTVRYIARTCVQSTEVSQPHKEYSGTAYNQQFCYSNYPIKCSTDSSRLMIRLSVLVNR